jgi:cell division ATPase FtsA
LERDSSFVFTKHLTDEILKKEEREFEKEAIDSFDVNVSDSTPYVLERKITQVFLNGYETSNPYFKKSKTADLSIYLSLSPQEPVKLVQNAIHNYFGVKKVDFHSFPFVTYNAIRDNFSDEDSFVFMDVASEVTDIILVRNNSIVKIVSFPIGKNLLIRNVMDMMGITAEVALSYLKMYAEKTSDVSLRKE